MFLLSIEGNYFEMWIVLVEKCSCFIQIKNGFHKDFNKHGKQQMLSL
jgi:hypothetical protein